MNLGFYKTTNPIMTNNQLIIKEIFEYSELYAEIKKYIFNKKELKLIEDAYSFATSAHEGQKRKNGDPFICHPLSAAYFLAQLRMGPKTIIAGLLHDVLEDTPITFEDIEKKFGIEVANLVEAVTKVSFFAKEKRSIVSSTYLRKIYLSMAKDIRVIIIKIADRLHNMLTIENLSIEKQEIIAKETLEIYSAIAHRIGMKNAKSHLEDMSFKVLNREEYNKIQKLLEQDNEKRNETIDKKIIRLEEYLRREKHIKIINIFGRNKTIYSIYRKMNFIGKSFEEITDLLAIRIITKSIDDCYKVLGYIHQIYIPIGGKFKDYIATPKNNVYQSLHTTVSDSEGNIFEIQIRTDKMDDIAETGAAAHWRYKEGEIVDIQKRQNEIDEKIDILRRIIDLDQANSSVEKEETENDIEQVLKEDIFTSSVYVLTPNGKVITLPFGSTVLDFAYCIHSEVGQHTMGARINGVYSPINTVLKSGQVVEIKTNQKQMPTHEWLKIAKTTSAKSKIKKYLTQKMEEENIKDKQDLIEVVSEKIKNNVISFINQKDLRWKKNDSNEIQQKIKELGYDSEEDFLFAIHKGDYTLEEAVDLVYVNYQHSKDDEAMEMIKSKTNTIVDLKNDIIVDGINNMKTSIASCCDPIPYEYIVGYVSKGNGIKVHLSNCINVTDEESSKRTVSVRWNPDVNQNKKYTTKIKIFATDRPSMLYDISKVLTSLKGEIINANLSVNEKNISVLGVLTLKIKDSGQLSQVMSAIKSIPGINSVERNMEKSKTKSE